MRRDARQQYCLLRQLIAAGNEDDVLDLISSMGPGLWNDTGPSQRRR